MAVHLSPRPAIGRPEVAPALFRLLAESALARAALDACGVPLTLVDTAADNSISYVNPAFERFFGYRAAEALGRSVGTLLSADAEAAARLYAVPEAQLLLRARRKDGSPAHVEVAVGALRGVDGRVTHRVLAFSDRTELEELRTELNALRAAATGV